MLISDYLLQPYQSGSKPFIIGVTGSVAVGKSTTSTLLKEQLSQWPDHPNVTVINTDGFLFSAKTLRDKNLMMKKGFPESYDNERMQSFLKAIKKGEGPLDIPVYSHKIYDLTGSVQTVKVPDILIVEGLNILQQPDELFDFIIYIDAPTEMIASWYIDRFKGFRADAKHDPDSFFHQFALIEESAAVARAQSTWKNINEVNLIEHILPLKHRADLIIEKEARHHLARLVLPEPQKRDKSSSNSF